MRDVSNAIATLLLVLVGSPARAAPLAVESRLGDGPWTRARVVALVAGESVAFRVDAREGETIRWYELVPDLSRDHHNAEWPWNPGAYAWLGFERVACRRIELPEWTGRREVLLPKGAPPALPPTFDEARPWLRQREWGTFWLQCEATSASGVVRRTPGVESSDARGLPTDALRISVRRGDGYLGWISTFANVPSVFGSTPYQSCNWLGADCADVVMVARSTWLDQPVGRDWSVASVVTTLPHRCEGDLLEGVAQRPMRWGHEVLPGDVVAVRYVGGRAFQHVGVLVDDADGDGMLGPADRVAHAGPLPLQVSPLRDGAFDGHVVVMDPGR